MNNSNIPRYAKSSFIYEMITLKNESNWIKNKQLRNHESYWKMS